MAQRKGATETTSDAALALGCFTYDWGADTTASGKRCAIKPPVRFEKRYFLTPPLVTSTELRSFH